MIHNVTEGCVEAAHAIFANLTDRRGVGNALEECDEEIQFEIKQTMAQIIAKFTDIRQEPIMADENTMRDCEATEECEYESNGRCAAARIDCPMASLPKDTLPTERATDV